jgi:DNA-binding winged helix-turn-helix (wHTH) protein/TolB-like protein/Tfp pilus assembly protein PilF
MPNDSLLNSPFTLHEWLVEPGLNQLRRQDIVVRLEPKSMEVLCVLAAHANETVSREDLIKTVWKGRVVVDEALSRSIAQLRRAFGDDQEAPSYIQTVRKRGYRLLVAPQQHVPPTENAVVESADEVVVPPTARGWSRKAALLTLTLGVLAAGLLWFGVSRPIAARLDSVAVLPLVNLTGDSAQQFVGDGLSEDLITLLARVPDLKVIARGSAHSLPREMDPLEAGKKLGASAVVQGSVRSEGQRVQINARVVRTSDGRVLWSQAFEGPGSGNLLPLRDALLAGVLTGLRIEEPVRRVVMARSHARDPVAHRLYLEGQLFATRRTIDSIELAAERFQQALAVDPNDADVHVALAQAHLLRGYWRSRPPSEVVPLARAEALRALELDPTLGAAHTVLAGIAFQHDWDWVQGEAEFRRAIELDPNDAAAHFQYAVMLQWCRRFAEARAEHAKARELDPLSLVIYVTSAAPEMFSGDYRRAEKILRAALELDPNFEFAHDNLAFLMLVKGDVPAAVAQYEATAARFHKSVYAELGYAYGAAGRTAQAREVLAAVLAEERQRYVSPYMIALLHLGLGEKDAAFMRLEEALRIHDDALQWILTDPRLESIAHDARFQRIVEQVGIAKAQRT